jgi:hypothetical protein
VAPSGMRGATAAEGEGESDVPAEG